MGVPLMPRIMTEWHAIPIQWEPATKPVRAATLRPRMEMLDSPPFRGA
jgi:hypothetical protein